jgi:hypothetical protein
VSEKQFWTDMGTQVGKVECRYVGDKKEFMLYSFEVASLDMTMKRKGECSSCGCSTHSVTLSSTR